MKEAYMNALQQARAELAALLKDRSVIDERIGRLNKSIEGLEALCDDADHPKGLAHKTELESADSMGMSDAIRAILGRASVPIRAPLIRDALVDEGFDPSEYSNMLTVIHNTLMRLEKQGEINRVSLPMGGFWGWIIKSRGLPPPPIEIK
jgi:hypothetical protein